jgi:hypothetical protein
LRCIFETPKIEKRKKKKEKKKVLLSVATTTDRSICWHHGAAKCIWWNTVGPQYSSSGLYVAVRFIWRLSRYRQIYVADTFGLPSRGGNTTPNFICKEFLSLYLSIHVINTPTVANIYST